MYSERDFRVAVRVSHRLLVEKILKSKTCNSDVIDSIFIMFCKKNRNNESPHRKRRGI
jgi:hypothetical protein